MPAYKVFHLAVKQLGVSLVNLGDFYRHRAVEIDRQVRYAIFPKQGIEIVKYFLP